MSELEDGGTLILQVAEDVDIRIAQGAVARRATGDESGAAGAAQPVAE